jgi:hypothetical protein
MLWDEVGISVDGNMCSVLSIAVLQMSGCKIISHWNFFRKIVWLTVASEKFLPRLISHKIFRSYSLEIYVSHSLRCIRPYALILVYFKLVLFPTPYVWPTDICDKRE